MCQNPKTPTEVSLSFSHLRPFTCGNDIVIRKRHLAVDVDRIELGIALRLSSITAAHVGILSINTTSIRLLTYTACKIAVVYRRKPSGPHCMT